MFSWFKRTPHYSDEAFAVLAQMLLEERDYPTHRNELLRREAIDYSLDSLLHIDEYLTALHRNPPAGDDYVRAVIRVGAYVGEVLRRHSGDAYHWVQHYEAARYSRSLRQVEQTIASFGILWRHQTSFCFPMARVIKTISKGPGDGVHIFVIRLLRALAEEPSPPPAEQDEAPEDDQSA